MYKVELKPDFYQGKECIGIYGPDTLQFNSTIKKIKGIKWNHNQRIFYIDCTRIAFENFKNQVANHFYLDTSILRQYLLQKKALVGPIEKPIRSVTANKIISHPLCIENSLALEAMRNMLILKGYSNNTIRNYLFEFQSLLRLLKENSVNNLSKAHIQSYLLWLLKEKGCSETKVHTAVNAIKFYFEHVLEREKVYNPVILTINPTIVTTLCSKIVRIVSVIISKSCVLKVRILFFSQGFSFEFYSVSGMYHPI